MASPRILKSEYDSAVEKYEREWRTLDDKLYRLCSEHPDHASAAGVFAKVFIVGRTYQTGIERQVETKGSQGSSISQVAERLLANSRTVDKLFNAVSSISEPIDATKLRLIAEIHGEVVRLLIPITRKERIPRAFVSKYMHFHFPAVPIYDSYAESSLRRLVQWGDALEVFEKPTHADQEYVWYLMRFLDLYEEAASRKFNLKVKYLDHYLVWKTDQKKKLRKEQEKQRKAASGK
jgi:hypothetical protein